MASPAMRQETALTFNEALNKVEHRLIVELGCDTVKNGEYLDICPVTYRFTPGLYIREIFMPASAVIVSKVHKTENLFVVTQGRCSVYTEECEWELIEAPHVGVTKVGTRRLLVMQEDTRWMTFHPNPDDITDLEVLDEMLFGVYENPLLEGVSND